MTRKPTPTETALEAFIARKARIDAILARLQRLSADHFEVDPETVNWADVGTIGHVLDHLHKASDFIFHEGEYER